MRRAACLVVSACALIAAADPGFTDLFDGKSTTGWTFVGGKPGNWHVKDGLLITKGEGGGWISTEKQYADFTLKLEYRLGPAGNSGVFIRAPHMGDPAYTGMEIQLLDDNDSRYKSLKPFQYTGSIYGVVAPERGHTKPPGEWNAIEISAIGSKVKVKLNGATIVDADVKKYPEAVAKHPGLERTSGYIGLQSHSEPLEFRNIQIRQESGGASSK